MDTLIRRRDVLRMGALASAAIVAGAPAFGLAKSRGSDRFDGRIVPPEAVGMSRQGLDDIRKSIQKNIDAKVIPGAVTAIARHNKLVMFEAFGTADVEAGTPMRKDSLFRMMSSSKPVTAVAVMMMMEQGKLLPEDPVSKFIPSFKNQRVAINPKGNTDPSKVTFVPAAREITIKDLLTHTSGLSSYEGISPGPAWMVNKLERSPKRPLSDVIPKFGSFALDFQPGSRWSYSPLDGFDTLLYIVELVSGVPADRFLKERIFEPLSMRNTFFSVPPSQMGSRVKLYSAKNGAFNHEPPIFGEMFGDGPFTYISGAGGIISCAADYLNFELMLLNHGSFNGRRLLKPETVALMTSNHVGPLFAQWIPFITAGNGFGYGLSILEDESKGAGRAAGAFGWGGAYGTETWADPKLDIAAVMLIQMNPAPSNVKPDFSKAIRSAIVA